MSRIGIATARVYIGGGNRRLSRRGAYYAEARARIKAKYPCECDAPDHAAGYPGNVCDRHAWDPKRWALLVRRLARFLAYLDRRERIRPKRA